MVTEKQINWNAIGNCVNTTFGNSGTKKEVNFSDPSERIGTEWALGHFSRGSYDAATKSVTFKFLSDTKLQISVANFVTFAGLQQRDEYKDLFEKEGIQVVKDALKKVADLYKEQTDGDKLKLKMVGNPDISFELTTMSVHSARQVALMRMRCLIDMSV